jgi:hypothetical protein
MDGLSPENLLDHKVWLDDPVEGGDIHMLTVRDRDVGIFRRDIETLLRLGLTRIQSNDPGRVSFYFVDKHAPASAGRSMREGAVSADDFIPVNIGERVYLEAHGQNFIIGYHSRNTYWLSTNPPGERRRWGDRRQITEDIAYVIENGTLPPHSGPRMFERRGAETTRRRRR